MDGSKEKKTMHKKGGNMKRISNTTKGGEKYHEEDMKPLCVVNPTREKP
jgi:hypothetical protein